MSPAHTETMTLVCFARCYEDDVEVIFQGSLRGGLGVEGGKRTVDDGSEARITKLARLGHGLDITAFLSLSDQSPTCNYYCWILFLSTLFCLLPCLCWLVYTTKIKDG